MNQKRYWLRGLLAGLMIPIFLQIIVNIFGGLGCMGFFSGVSTSVFSSFMCPLLEWKIVYYIVALEFFPLWLISGLILGWIYGKIKNKQKIDMR